MTNDPIKDLLEELGAKGTANIEEAKRLIEETQKLFARTIKVFPSALSKLMNGKGTELTYEDVFSLADALAVIIGRSMGMEAIETPEHVYGMVTALQCVLRLMGKADSQEKFAEGKASSASEAICYILHKAAFMGKQIAVQEEEKAASSGYTKTVVRRDDKEALNEFLRGVDLGGKPN